MSKGGVTLVMRLRPTPKLSLHAAIKFKKNTEDKQLELKKVLDTHLKRNH